MSAGLHNPPDQARRDAGSVKGGLFARLLRCRLCWRISLTVLMSIVIVEAAILFPSMRNYEGDLLHRIEDSVTAAMAARVNPHVDDPRTVLVALAAAKANYPALLGGQIYDAGGDVVGTFGEAPKTGLSTALEASRRERRIDGGDRFELLWPSAASGMPFDVVARADSSWVAGEFWSFVLRISGLVLLISAVATSAALLVLGRTVLLPLLNLRESMSAVGADPANPEQHITATRRRDELGELITHFNGLVQLLSERHREALTRVVAMADNAVDGIVAYGRDNPLVYANNAALQYFGVTAPDQLAEIDWHLEPAEDIGNGGDTGPGGKISIREAAATGASSREYLLVMPDGRRRPVLCGANRLLDNNGEPILFFASLRDITAHKAAEQALIDAKQQADIANRAKSGFLATMSHELRTPLNAINGFSEIIEGAALGPVGDARYQEYAGDIHQSGKRLLTIIEDILELSRIESGQFQLNPTRIDLDTFLANEIAGMQSDFDAKSHDVSLDIAPGAPMLEGDRQGVRQIVRNLLSNACKYTPDGGRIAVTASEASSGGIAIEIRDTGIGIPADALERVLEPFTQADGSLARRYEGTGLGLALAATFAKLHDGRVELESKVGQGTTVRVYFPATRCHPHAAAE